MKSRSILLVLSAFVLSFVANGQAPSKAEIREARKEAIREKNEQKQGVIATAAIVNSPFNDADSFGKGVKFLGSLYAGTVYVYHTCDPVLFEQELGAPLAADDKCVAYTPNDPSVPPPGSSTFEFYDPAWEFTIPGRTVDNVIYPLLNNSVGFDSFSTTPTSTMPIIRPVTYFYVPRVTIVSDALNDPAAIDPGTGLPMNGSFTTSLSGSVTRTFSVPTGEFLTDYRSYASVSGRGLSRAYFKAIGLPDTVINNLFKKDMTLKFGIRGRATGPIDFSQMFFTYRLVGN